MIAARVAAREGLDALAGIVFSTRDSVPFNRPTAFEAPITGGPAALHR